MEPYLLAMKSVHRPGPACRFRRGADRSLCRRRRGTRGWENIVAESIQYRSQVETDFAITNSTGPHRPASPARSPSSSSTTSSLRQHHHHHVFLSGLEVQELFNYIARRSSIRGCSAQAQISGATVVLKLRRPEGL